MKMAAPASTNGLLAVVALLLALNLIVHLAGGSRSDPGPPVAGMLSTPAQGQVFTTDGRIYTASQDGRTLIIWRRNMQVWEPEVFEVGE